MISASHSMQGRLLTLVLGLVTTVWLATAIITWFDVNHELDELLDSHLAQAAALLVVQQAGEGGDEDRRIDAPILHRYAPKVAFQVFHEGRLTQRSAGAPAAPMIGSADVLRAGFRTVQIDGTHWRVFAANGGERDVQVYVGEQMQSRSAILWAALRSMFWPMLLALPLLAVAVWWAVLRGVAPLRQLGRTLAERQPQALHPVAIADAPSEMAPMLAALNGLLERIAALVESERRFTADAAHELRTPIAGIRAQAQVALGEVDGPQRHHALLSTLDGCDRATRLVDQLLTLSRLEAGSETAMMPVDLSALVRNVAADLTPQAMQKDQTIAVDAAAPCLVTGDATLITVLVRNLVDNAIRYSPANAAVSIVVGAERGKIRLTVEDSGPGMTEPDIQRMGERFFRVIGTGQSGSGLGWSIVRRIADVQHTALHIGHSVALGGLAVEVDWPASS